MQRETFSRYELLIPQGDHAAAVPITAPNDNEAIARAWAYLLNHPAIVTATLQQNGRIVSHLSRQG